MDAVMTCVLNIFFRCEVLPCCGGLPPYALGAVEQRWCKYNMHV